MTRESSSLHPATPAQIDYARYFTPIDDDPAEPKPWNCLIPIALALLASALMLFGDYQLGSGNQAIQIPFLKHFIDPELFKNDPMVNATLSDYPSYFFQALAFIVNKFGLEKSYLALHFLTTFAFLHSLHFLSTTLFKDWLASILAVLFAVMGHHQTLAGDPLYFTYFTHTWFVFPIAIYALAFFLRGWPLLAFILAGLVFNLHALTAAYLVFMFAFASLRDLKSTGWKKPLLNLLAFLLIAFPTLLVMAKHKQVYDALWLDVMRWRSADHSFPSTWWDLGNSEIPRFLLLIAIGALSFAFPSKAERQRKVFWMAFAVLVLFFIGWLFTESPLALSIDNQFNTRDDENSLKSKLIAAGFSLKNTVLRAQPFRSSRLLMILIFVQAAHACSRMIQRCAAPIESSSSDWFTLFFHNLARWVDFLLAIALALALAFPPMIHFLPWIVALMTLMALIHGRLAWPMALASVFALTIAFRAFEQISFLIPLLPNQSLPGFRSGWNIFAPALIALGVGVGILLIHEMRLRWWANAVILLEGLAVIGLLVWRQYPQMIEGPQNDPWVQTQLWVKNNTPKDALILVPPSQGGFRIFSDRSVVGEWRDGTQAYFNAKYAGTWWGQMLKLMPGMNVSETRVIDRGNPLQSLQGVDLANLSKQFNASHLILPLTERAPQMQRVYSNDQWQILLPNTYKPVPPGVIDEQAWLDAEDFMNTIVQENIEKYRKGDVKITLVDAVGKPLDNVQYQASQTRQAFLFGATLPFFKPNTRGSGVISDETQDPVKESELALFPELFNFSMIGFSGKWMYTEPTEGVKKYEDLDAYVDWCVKNNVDMEFHYIGGIAPKWIQNYKSQADIDRLLKAHALEIVDRYHDRIKYFQLTNDDYYAESLLPAVKPIREKYPHLKLGLSHCTRLTLGRDVVGLPMVQSYANRGAKMDFYAPHAHIPRGLWIDPIEVYGILDRIAAQGVKIHASEAVFPLTNIVGDLRSGKWTPQLQADYAEWYYTLFFSHPASEAINYWNFTSDSNQPGAGLLTPDAKPTPMYTRLKELIRGKWMTHIPQTPLTNGQIAFRGFHGDYELKITHPDGKTTAKKFSILEDKDNVYRFVLDEQGQIK